MDIGMREILIVLGCVIMAVLFFDAYRRVRDHRRSQLGCRLQDRPESNCASLDGFDDDEDFDSELTPVRPVDQRDGPITQRDHVRQRESRQILDGPGPGRAQTAPAARPQRQSSTPSQIRVRISTPKFQQTEVNDDPMLSALADGAPAQTNPDITATQDLPDLELKPTRKGTSAKRSKSEDRFPLLQAKQSDGPIKALLQPALATAPEAGDFYSNRRRSQASVSARKQQDAREAAEHSPQAAGSVEGPIDVIVMHVAASKNEVFEGEVLVQQVLALNLRHGDMKIFHRYERPEQHQGLLFSMANMVKPGNFELDHMSAFDTPGVTFFLTLPCAGGALYAFDLMVDTARKLSKNLDGELRDETQSVITPQTVEHYRQRVMEFERKQRMLEKTRQIREKSKHFE